MRRLTKQEAELMLLQIKTTYQNFILNNDVINLWTEFLMDADAEMAVQNLKDHIMNETFPPVIAQIVRKNERVQANRDIQETRKMIDEQEKLRLETSTITPWEKEGITHREYLHRILGESRGKKDA